MTSIFVIGIVGLPARYGGFETLVENLISHSKVPEQYTVLCSARRYSHRPTTYNGAHLRYIGFHPNGASSIVYDFAGTIQAMRSRASAILVLGVSGAMIFPFVRLLSRTKIVCNIDGREWKRQKWGWLARTYLKWSERIAVKYAHHVIADSTVIADDVQSRYGVHPVTIAYGGDQAPVSPAEKKNISVDPPFALMICRIEPENNVAMVLKAFAEAHRPLTIVGNWKDSNFGVQLHSKYVDHDCITLLDATYDPNELGSLRSSCGLYVHGHSAGGTNPSLVEAMHLSIPILCFDCDYNRETTEDKSLYFCNDEVLNKMIQEDWKRYSPMGPVLLEIAERRYTWSTIVKKYEQLLIPKPESSSPPT